MKEYQGLTMFKERRSLGRSGSQSLAVATSASSPRAEDGAVGSTLPSLTQPPRERPILFSGAMVRAILEGKKTQTRRVVKVKGLEFIGGTGQYNDPDAWGFENPRAEGYLTLASGIPCPYGKPGDRLWVRETWSHSGVGVWSIADARMAPTGKPFYMADGGVGPWWPSIHMPREFSRITLEIVSVRVERLQDISDDDAKAEGVERIEGSGLNQGWRDYAWKGSGDVALWNASWSYHTLWELINGPGSWDANPWVWVVEFRRVSDRSGTPQAGNPAEEYSEERGPRNEGDALKAP